MTSPVPRIYLHPDGATISIGFEGTNDTLLSLNGGPEAWRDKERLAAWVAEVENLMIPASLFGTGDPIDGLRIPGDDSPAPVAD